MRYYISFLTIGILIIFLTGCSGLSRVYKYNSQNQVDTAISKSSFSLGLFTCSENISDGNRWDPTNIVRKNQLNNLTVKKIRSQTDLYVNNKFVTSAVSPTFFGNKLGFYVEGKQRVEIDNIEVNKLPLQKVESIQSVEIDTIEVNKSLSPKAESIQSFGFKMCRENFCSEDGEMISRIYGFEYSTSDSVRGERHSLSYMQTVSYFNNDEHYSDRKELNISWQLKNKLGSNPILVGGLIYKDLSKLWSYTEDIPVIDALGFIWQGLYWGPGFSFSDEIGDGSSLHFNSQIAIGGLETFRYAFWLGEYVAYRVQKIFGGKPEPLSKFNPLKGYINYEFNANLELVIKPISIGIGYAKWYQPPLKGNGINLKIAYVFK